VGDQLTERSFPSDGEIWDVCPGCVANVNDGNEGGVRVPGVHGDLAAGLWVICASEAPFLPNSLHRAIILRLTRTSSQVGR